MKHTYILDGSRIISERYSNIVIYYIYDESGSPIGLSYKSGNYDFENYFFTKNLQGDILNIYTEQGELAVSYEYDAWGNFTDTVSNLPYPPSTEELQALTLPFRYRGYYYDQDTGFYYLNSRYYDAKVCRFVSPDSALASIGELQTNNMYVYACNNPIVYSDYSGQWPKISTVFAIVAVVAVAVAVVAVSVATCGTATAALAGAATVATTTSSVASAAIGVATTAIQVSIIATAASLTANAVETKIEDITNNNISEGETVYKLVDEEGTVQYVGRTKNEAARKAAHKNNPHREHLRFEPIERGLSKEAARGLEQYYMAVYHTINTANRTNNQINGVSPNNSKLKIYIEAASKYVENKITNEILYWTGN